MPQFASGWQAARADGWCIQCMKRQAEPDKSMCADCAEARNQRSLNRNASRPSSRMTRRTVQAVFDQAAESKEMIP